MSVLSKEEICPKQSINKNKIKEIILGKILNLNSPNINKRINEHKTDSKENFFYKKVLIKPFTAKKKNYLNQFKIHDYLIHNTTGNHNLDNNSYNNGQNINCTNSNIFVNFENGIELDNNELILNNTNPEIIMKKIYNKNHKNNRITNNKDNKNLTSIELYESNNSDISKLKPEQISIINEKTSKDKSKELSMSLFGNKKDNVNINYINSISNNVYGKINSPIYLNKIYSLSNIDDNFNLMKNITLPIQYQNKQKINKNLKKKSLVNDTELNLYMNKTSKEDLQKNDYFNSIIEIYPNSKIEEIEIDSSKNDDKIEKINFLENKKKILYSIERQKKKLLDENHKNHIKYIKLIQKQQQQYKQYDQYLKKELQKNRNSQIKLLLFKENFFKALKKQNKSIRNEVIPAEFKALSSTNFNKQLKPQSKLTKNKNFHFKNINNKLKINKKYLQTENNECSINNENSINFIRISKNRYSARPCNKIKIIIKEKELKKKNPTNMLKIANKLIHMNNSSNFNNYGKNISNTSNLNIERKPIIGTERSFNYDWQNFSSEIKNRKKENKIKFNIFNHNKSKKTDDRELSLKKKNILFENKAQTSLILKKLVKNIKNEIERKCLLNKGNNNQDVNIQKHCKSNSFKKENISEVYYEPNNKMKKENKIHKMILEEKQKFFINSSDRKPNYIKFKNSNYFLNLKTK